MWLFGRCGCLDGVAVWLVFVVGVAVFSCGGEMEECGLVWWNASCAVIGMAC